MNTLQILSAAYADIFGIEADAEGHFHDQRAGKCVIDYAYFGHNAEPFDMDADYIEATTESGSEGCWIGVFRMHYDAETHGYTRSRVGTIKTLDEGRDAWRDMGALAGELAYVSNSVIAWKLYKAEQEAE